MHWLGRHLIALDRLAIVHWVLIRLIPRAIARRFDPAAARGLEATVELAIADPHGRPSTCYAVVISGGRCRVAPGTGAPASARAAVRLDDLIALGLGGVGWPELFSRGRFVLTGDPFLALRFASLFGLPSGSGPACGRH